MELPNDIVLRPRFKIEVNTNHQTLLQAFEGLKKNSPKFIITRVDDHVFLKYPKQQQHFWSPQLHLEINEKDDSSSTVYGLFGPNPTVWTLFMFLHFVVAGLFFGFAVWAYTNATLGNDYAIQLFLTLMMVVLWFVLYFAGRMGRAKGKPEMHQLHKFMQDTLSAYR